MDSREEREGATGRTGAQGWRDEQEEMLEQFEREDREPWAWGAFLIVAATAGWVLVVEVARVVGYLLRTYVPSIGALLP